MIGQIGTSHATPVSYRASSVARVIISSQAPYNLRTVLQSQRFAFLLSVFFAMHLSNEACRDWYISPSDSVL